jgi:hypothetical protein
MLMDIPSPSPLLPFSIFLSQIPNCHPRFSLAHSRPSKVAQSLSQCLSSPHSPFSRLSLAKPAQYRQLTSRQSSASQIQPLRNDLDPWSQSLYHRSTALIPEGTTS